VLATGPNSRVSSVSGTTRNQTVATGHTTWTTQTIGHGPVLPPKTRHFKCTNLPPIKNLSSDRIMTWSLHTLCSFSRSFTSSCQISNRTNILWVAIENPPISLAIWRYFRAIPRILVRTHIWQLEVQRQLELHNLHTDDIMIWSELRYWISVKHGGTAKIELQSRYNPAKNSWFISHPGNQPANTKRFGFLAG